MDFFDPTGNIRAELLDIEAKRIAESLSNQRDRRENLTPAQLRRFFGEFRSLEKKVKVDGFGKVKPLIKMVKSKAAYAANPSNPKIPRSFKNFLSENIDKINSEKEFAAFMLYFESVVGFFYGMENVRNN